MKKPLAPGKLSVGTKFVYGLGDLSSNICFSAINFYLLYFLINVAGLEAGLASIVFLIAKAWDAVTDYFMGRLCDKTKSKWGKHRVYIMFGAIPFGIAFALLWLSPASQQWSKLLYYTVMYMLYNTAWTIVYIPYSAIAANMTSDYDERTSMNGYKIIEANIGIILGAAVFSLLAEGEGSVFYGLTGSIPTSYAIAAIVFAVVAAVVMFVCGYFCKEKEEPADAAPENQKSFFTTLKEFFKLREFRKTIMYYLLSMVGFDIIMAVFMFFINYALKFGSPDMVEKYGSVMSMIFVAIPLVVAILSATVWVKLSEKMQKHKVYAISCVYMAVVLLFAVFVPEKNVVTTVLLCLFAGFGMSAIQILPYGSLPDVVEVDEYTYGVRREGAYYGIASFMYKLASGLGVAIVSWILELLKFKESADGTYIEQSSGANLAIRLILGILPGVIFLISIYYAYASNMNRERHKAIVAELGKRRSAKADPNRKEIE